MACDFSYQHYRVILKKALQDGFLVTSFRDLQQVKNSPKIIILRHDIDALPENHLILAKIEESLGIKATYFVRVHGQYYHLASQKTLKALNQIKKMGHEIGLHSEARSLAPVFRMDPVELFRSEKAILEDIFNIKILSASEHGDLKHAKNFWENHFFKRIPKQKVLIKHYPQMYPQFHYLSDSLQEWREGCLCQNLDKFPLLQVLIHAEWWGKNALGKMIKLNKAYAEI